jgi:glucosamine-6-phosphate deaminase
MALDPTGIPPEQLGVGSSIALEVVDSDVDLYYHIAWTMFDALRENNAIGRPTVFIVPVGPVGQYRRFAAICNRYCVSCRDLHLFNMDEYLTDEGEYLPREHPLSFRSFMRHELYERVLPELRPPLAQIVFPDPHAPERLEEQIAALGGVQIAFGGVGITGHLAFNEPPEPGEAIGDDEFANLPTRVLALARESRAINAHTAASGDIAAIPRLAVTVGMREILAARSLRFYLNRPWQRAIARRILHGPVTAHFPASFLQRHADARLVITAEVAQTPTVRLA